MRSEFSLSNLEEVCEVFLVAFTELIKRLNMFRVGFSHVKNPLKAITEKLIIWRKKTVYITDDFFSSRKLRKDGPAEQDIMKNNKKRRDWKCESIAKLRRNKDII